MTNRLAAEPPAYWLMKTEPETFSFDDLERAPGRRSGWEGVRNYQARNLMRDQFRLGDLAFIYHSSCAVPAIIGIARIVRTAYPDLTALDTSSPYFDAASVRQGASRWCMVDVQAWQRFAAPVTLAQLRSTPKLAAMALLKTGNRLSIQPVTENEWRIILSLGTLKPVS